MKKHVYWAAAVAALLLAKPASANFGFGVGVSFGAPAGYAAPAGFSPGLGGLCGPILGGGVPIPIGGGIPVPNGFMPPAYAGYGCTGFNPGFAGYGCHGYSPGFAGYGCNGGGPGIPVPNNGGYAGFGPANDRVVELLTQLTHDVRAIRNHIAAGSGGGISPDAGYGPAPKGGPKGKGGIEPPSAGRKRIEARFARVEATQASWTAEPGRKVAGRRAELERQFAEIERRQAEWKKPDPAFIAADR